MQAKSFLNEQGKENQFSDIILKKRLLASIFHYNIRALLRVSFKKECPDSSVGRAED